MTATVALKVNLITKTKENLILDNSGEAPSNSFEDSNQQTDTSGEKGMNVNRWVCRIKRKSDGTVERYRARLVAKGYSQQPGIDYEDTFAPFARYDTMRLLFSTIPRQNDSVTMFDVKTAFLYGDLDATAYMEQPEGFITSEGKVCK